MKKKNSTADAARLELMLGDLRLPAFKMMWAELAERADKEGWPAARFLATLLEHEITERDRRRIERHMSAARLPVGKTIDSFDFTAVPMVSKAQVMALAASIWLSLAKWLSSISIKNINHLKRKRTPIRSLLQASNE